MARRLLTEKQKKMGWKEVTVQEFLGLSEEEMELIRIRRSLLRLETDLRTSKRISQKSLADLLGSSSSRISKMEKDDSSVSIGLILRAIVSLGGTHRQIGRALLGA